MRTLFINPSILHSYMVCERQAWLEFRGFKPSRENEDLDHGRQIHRFSFPDGRKEILVDNFLKIDLLKDGMIAEIKKSSKRLEAARIQLAYYLYYLRKFKGIETKGILIVPDEKYREIVELTPEIEMILINNLREAEVRLSSDTPPNPKPYEKCKKCSYFEFCHGD